MSHKTIFFFAHFALHPLSSCAGALYGAVHAGLIPSSHPFLASSQLAVEATRHLAALLGQLRGPSALSLPTPIMLVLISR